ncbi:sodium:solute symporter family protein [Edaphobacter albus]|uniref:sodium:solute symporter family protein n=1 Tax=Edaphobacter sp. 4G125 TaxID=2763071 RepID=UPI0016448B39|nr:sodium:solute symporter family protein [Edaphobacter sp. 4G125]QNI37282.1 sodium:solute symporter family protein [Edaphobacter sp. 4G125]
MNIYLIALLLYSIFLMALGIVMSRRVKNSSDFLVAGRSLGPGRLFATFLAANIGAGSTVGATGLGYRMGMSAWWWVGSACIGTFLLSQFLGPKLWRIAKEHGLATLQDYLEFRYNKAVKAIISILFWFGALAILAGQLIAISWILNTVAGIPKWEGCLIGGIVAIVYCTAGGMMSSSFVNMFELAVTMSGLLLAVPFAFHALGGWAHMHELVLANTGSAAKTNALFSMTGAGTKQLLAWIAILVPSFMISPGLVQKVYGARDVKTVRWGVGLNSLGQAIFAFVPPVLGLCAFAAMPHLANAELALPTAMKTLLPEWLGVWTLASIFSAELSATDAILFMLSTSLAVDLYKTFLNPGVSQQKMLWVSRLSSIGAGVVGILLAAVLPSIIQAVSIFYGLIAVALFVPVVAGLYSRRVLAPAAMCSIVAALSATVLTIRLTHGAGVGVLSPQAIGIATAAVVMIGFRVFAPSRPTTEVSSSVQGAVL